MMSEENVSMKGESKILFQEALQTAVKRREAKSKGEMKDIPIWMQSSREQPGEIWKPSSVISAKKQRKTIQWERLEISSRI